jgi:SAM-dependent methyltransferase
MGRTDSIIFPWYKSLINNLKGDVALLGFQNTNHFNGDLYDDTLGNWNINSEWSLKKKYDTIICTRCAYFAKNPEDFILKCYDSLKPNGEIYIDWGLGDHWRFPLYKIGWVRDGEHEYAHKDDNFLWSTVWDDSFLENDDFKIFESNVLKLGYDDVKAAIFSEVPEILDVSFIDEYFDSSIDMLTVWEDLPQLYILISGIRKKLRGDG